MTAQDELFERQTWQDDQIPVGFSTQPGAAEIRDVGSADAEIISAIPLTDRQRRLLEIRLIRMLRKHMNLKFSVDPALLGGVRIITNNILIDDSIKHKLFEMRSEIEKGVFQTE
jgi:F-type H+-transporting ATPase subunit delta